MPTANWVEPRARGGGKASCEWVWGKTAVERLAHDGAMAGARWAVAHLAHRVDGLGCIILLDSEGRVGHAFNTPRMAYAYIRDGLERPVLGIQSWRQGAA